MIYDVVLRCSLCHYNPNEMRWTGTFHTVCRNLEDNTIILTNETYIPYPYHRSLGGAKCTFGISPALQEIEIRFQLCRLKVQSCSAHLVHGVCLKTLQNLLGHNISAEKLFMICRLLEREYGKEEVADLDLYDPSFDPTKPIIDMSNSNNLSQYLVDNKTMKTRFDTLPLEIKWIVLSYLDAKSLLSYFNCSREAFELTTTFPSWQLLYRQFKFPRIQDFIMSSFERFDDTDYLALDSLLLWLEDLNRLADNVKVIPTSDTFSFKIPTFLSPTDNFPLGHRRIFTQISTAVKGLTTYMISIRGRDYICGIEGIPPNSCWPIGHLHGTTQRIFFSLEKTNDLNFLVDSLGLRSLQIGESTWSSGTPGQLGCFEGRSILGNGSIAELVVFTDALKFRRIGWNQQFSIQPSPHISETIIMRPQRLELTSPRDVIYLNSSYCDWSLQNFFTITTESIIFDNNMIGISIIFWDHKINGIRVHFQGSSKFIGQLGDREEFFSIHGNEEAINRIDICIPWSTAIRIYTTSRRVHTFGRIDKDDRCHTFLSSQGQPINGLIIALFAYRLSLVAVSSGSRK